eukprot:TRINITY_DN1430_c0_g1_i1.p1 TRINITY_DN1430_c0_g1~~TRINITY_DN1430_c0_g1_i1.p1  ORF type:complete len:927 (+),score=438.60 TRINITY_DN1430_c0_g1_i1:170-2950(+)
MAMSATDRRKMRKLEEDLEESEKARKKFERDKQKLERDFKELQEKFDSLSSSGKDKEWSAKKTEELLDNKHLERTISSLESEVERLKKEIKTEKDKTASAQRNAREILRSDVDSDSIKKQDFENQLEELKKQLEAEKEVHAKEIESLKADFAAKDPSKMRRSAHMVGGGGAARPRDPKVAGGKAFDSLTSNYATLNEENARELKELRKKLEQEENNAEKEKKRLNKEVSDLQTKIKDVTLLKTRAEGKLQKTEDEVKRLTTALEKETKAKWETEKDKMSKERELKDTQKLLKDRQDLFQKQTEDMIRIEGKMKETDIKSKDILLNNTRLEREYQSHKKEASDDIDRMKLKYERRIQALEDEVGDLKMKTTRAEGNEGDAFIQSKKIAAELQKVKNQFDYAQSEWERERKRLERQLDLNSKASGEELVKMREEQKRLEDRRQREAKLLEELQSKTSVSDLLSKNSSVNVALDKISVETEMMKQKEQEKGKRTEQELKLLRDTLIVKSKQYEDEIDDLQRKLTEKERNWQREKERIAEDQAEREKEATADKKKTQERDKQRMAEFEQLNNDLIDERNLRKQLEDKWRKATDDLRLAENDLEDEKEERKLDNEKNSGKMKLIQEELQEVLSENHDLQLDVRKLENAARDAEDELLKTKRSLEDVKLALEDTQKNLADVQTELEKAVLQAKQKQEELQLKLDVAVHEAKEESKEKERQTKLRQAAERRVEELEYYFLPVDQQDKERDFYTPALLLMKKKKAEEMAELEALRKKHAKLPDSAEELRERFVNGIKSIPESNKEAAAYQLQGLMQSLEAAQFDLKTRMRICVALVEGIVEPEIIREVRILAEIMVESSLHFMDTPETVVVLARRDIDEEKARPDYATKKRSEVLNFRDVLLDRLARMRSARMHKPKAEVKKGIMDEVYTVADG